MFMVPQHVNVRDFLINLGQLIYNTDLAASPHSGGSTV